MNSIALLLALINGYKTVLLGDPGRRLGVGDDPDQGTMAGGISEIFQALALVFSGASVVGLRLAVAELSALSQAIHGQATGTTPARAPAPARPRVRHRARGQGELTARGAPRHARPDRSCDEAGSPSIGVWCISESDRPMGQAGWSRME